MVRVVITEAHEGLGLALVKEYLSDAENQVIAFCGDEMKSDRLRMLQDYIPEEQLLVVPVNLADEELIKASVKPIEGFVDALDLLIFNTGFVPDECFLGNDIPEDVLKTFVFKVFKSPRWLHENLFHLFSKGNNSKLVSMSLYSDRHEDYMIYSSLGLPIMAEWTFGALARDIDPSLVTVIHVSELWGEDILENESVRSMNMIGVIGHESIKIKAKALFMNIPKLPHGRHLYNNKRHTF